MLVTHWYIFMIMCSTKIKKMFCFFTVRYKLIFRIHYLSVYILCLSVTLYPIHVTQNGWTDRAQILCGTSHDPGRDLWMIKLSKISLQQILCSLNLENPWNFSYKIWKLFWFLFYNDYKEKMFNWNRRSGAKCPESIVLH